VFNVPPQEQHSWLEARSETLQTHLRHCSFWPLEPPTTSFSGSMQALAVPPLNNCITDGVDSTPHTQRTYVPIVSPQPIRFNQVPPIANWTGFPSQFPSVGHNPDKFNGSPIPSPAPAAPVQFPQPRTSVFRQQFNEPSPPQYAASPSQNFISSNGSISRSSSHLSMHRGATPFTHPSKFQRTASGTKRPQSSFTDSGFTEERQKQFEDMLMRLTASAGLSLNWVTNPEFISFCREFIPEAKVPSWKSLTNRILPHLLNNIHTGIKNQVGGQFVTVQCDGWTGPNSHHLIAFMITTSNKVRDLFI
jgi:hypothetical protein